MEWTFWNIVLACILIFGGAYLLKKIIDNGPAIVLFIVGVVMMLVGGFVYVISAFALRMQKEGGVVLVSQADQKALRIWHNLHVDMLSTYLVPFHAFSPAVAQQLQSSGLPEGVPVVVRRCAYSASAVHQDVDGVIYVIPERWITIFTQSNDPSYMRGVLINLNKLTSNTES